MLYHSIDDVKRANVFFFSPATMTFFRSRVGQRLYGGRYFITSEQQDARHARLYTVREATPDGQIKNASEFQQFETAGAARRFAERLAASAQPSNAE